MFLSRVSCSLRVRHRFKLVSSSVGEQTLAPVMWLHNRRGAPENVEPCSYKLSVGNERSWNQNFLRNFNRSLSTTSKERLELDPKSDDENAADETLSSFPEDGSKKPEEYSLHMSEEDLQELTGGDPELIQKVKYIQLEHELYRQEGILVPSKIKLSRWRELLALQSKNQRKKFYIFLFKTEIKQAATRRKKEEEQKERLERLGPKIEKENDQYGMRYGLGMNTIFHRIYDSAMAKHYHNKIYQEYKFGRPIVYDLSYDEYMTHKEAKNCAKQIEITMTENKNHPQPFCITLCNAHKELKVMQYLLHIIPTLYEDDYFQIISEKSYLDLFPKENLVYLSPNAKDYIEEFDEDDVYIVGAMVDKTDPRPLSMAKAKKENLRMQKLPLDKYLDWGVGGKSLTLNQMNNIMLDLRYTKDWPKSLRFVPTRKLRRDEPGTAQESDAPPRHERKSRVFEDYDVLNRSKGLGFRDSNRFEGRNVVKSRRDGNNSSFPINMRIRSIMRDD